MLFITVMSISRTMSDAIQSTAAINISPWVLAARPKTLPAGIAPVILGSALAFSTGAFQWIPMILCLLFSVLVQIGCNYANDYYDHVNGVDTKERIGFPRMVNSGLIAPKMMRKVAYCILFLALVAGSGLIYYGGWWLTLVGLLSVVCAIGYTAGPFPIGYHGFGDIFVFIFYGLVAVAFTFYVQTNFFSKEVFLVASACGLLAANIRLVNDLRDRDTDAKAGKKTSAVRFGPFFCYVQYFFSNLCAMVFVPALLIVEFNFSGWTALAILTILPGLRAHLDLMRAKTGDEYNKLLERTAKILLAYAILLSVGIVLSTSPDVLILREVLVSQ